MEGYLAEVRCFAGNFAPYGWMFCQGQQLSISGYDALFTLIGTTYGGDGQNNFRLPNLSGRVAVGAGTGSGLTPRGLGDVFGVENVTLTSPQIPAHAHGTNVPVQGLTLKVSDAEATVTDPIAGQHLATLNETGLTYLGYTALAPDKALATESLDKTGLTTNMTSVGNSIAHENMQPFLVLNYIICVEGIYPSRS